MFSYLRTHDGPVIEGLEAFERVYAKDQPEYVPLRTLPSDSGAGAISRWTLTDAERVAIVRGADILLELTDFGRPLQPIRMMITDQVGEKFAEWWVEQTRAPFVAPPSDAMSPELKIAELMARVRALEADNQFLELECVETRKQRDALKDFVTNLTGSPELPKTEQIAHDIPHVSGLDPVPQPPLFYPGVFGPVERVEPLSRCIGYASGCDGDLPEGNHVAHCPEWRGILHNANLPDFGTNGEIRRDA